MFSLDIVIVCVCVWCVCVCIPGARSCDGIGVVYLCTDLTWFTTVGRLAGWLDLTCCMRLFLSDYIFGVNIN